MWKQMINWLAETRRMEYSRTMLCHVWIDMFIPFLHSSPQLVHVRSSISHSLRYSTELERFELCTYVSVWAIYVGCYSVESGKCESAVSCRVRYTLRPIYNLEQGSARIYNVSTETSSAAGACDGKLEYREERKPREYYALSNVARSPSCYWIFLWCWCSQAETKKQTDELNLEKIKIFSNVQSNDNIENFILLAKQ